MGGLIFYYALRYLITLAFLAPLGICLLYCFIAIRQWIIGNKENNAAKRLGALKVITITLFGMVLIVVLWWRLLFHTSDEGFLFPI
jgi:hypothetical protein